MKPETQLAKTLSCLTDTLIAIRECQDKNSDGGETVTTKEFKEIIFPLVREVKKETESLYASIVEEHNKHEEILMMKCLSCSKNHKDLCRVFGEMSKKTNLDWGTWQKYAEVNNGVCLEDMDNTFYFSDGTSTEDVNKSVTTPIKQ